MLLLLAVLLLGLARHTHAKSEDKLTHTAGAAKMRQQGKDYEVQLDLRPKGYR